MKCYNHHDRDAFGVCKVCGKGLCLECMDKDSEIVVCTNEHRHSLLPDKVLNVLFILVGIVCFVMAFSDDFDIFKILLGVISVSIGVSGIRKARKRKKV